MIRAAMSDGPPAGEATIRRIGLFGQNSWAAAVPIMAKDQSSLGDARQPLGELSGRQDIAFLQEILGRTILFALDRKYWVGKYWRRWSDLAFDGKQHHIQRTRNHGRSIRSEGYSFVSAR